MTPTITPQQRDALYEHILDRLSGINDLWRAVTKENFATASRLGQEFADDLRIVLADLGWGNGPEGDIELTAPPDVLRRVFSRSMEQAKDALKNEEAERLEAQAYEEQSRFVVKTCQKVLEELDGASSD